MNSIQLRQQPDALLLVGVGAGDDDGAGFGLAGIVGKVGHAGWDIDEIAAVDAHVLLQVVTVPHSGSAADDVNGGLVAFVQMRPGAFARRYFQQVHADPARAGVLGRNAGAVGESLLAGVDVLRAN